MIAQDNRPDEAEWISGWRFGLLIVLFAALLFNPFADPDLFGHLLYGEWILGGVDGSEAWRIPDRGHFSLTASNRAWIDHEWLFHAVLALLYRAFGGRGPLIYQLIMTLGILGFLGLSMRRRAHGSMDWLTGMLLPVLGLRSGITSRPQLVTYLGLAFLFWLFTRQDRGRGYWWILPPLFLVWANLHGGFVAGLVVGAAFLPAIARSRSRWEAVRCLGWLAAAGAVTLINPYGYRLWTYLIRELTNPMASVLISEWQPLWARPYHFLIASLLCVQGGWVLMRKDRPVRGAMLESIPVLVMLVATVRSGRNLPLLAMAVATTGTVGLPPPRRAHRWVSRLLTVTCVLAVALLGYRLAGGLRIPDDEFPYGLARPLLDTRGSRNVYAHLDWAQWLLFQNPELRVFLDGRFSTLYSPELIKQYARTMLGDMRYLDAYHVQWVIVPPWYPINHQLRQREDWHLVHSNERGKLWTYRPAR